VHGAVRHAAFLRRLSMMAEHVIHCNPFSGHLLVFCNRRTDRLKILYWDRDGWVIWYKRLGGVLSQALFSIMGIPLLLLGCRLCDLRLW